MQEQIKVYRENGEMTALTYDSLGAQISLSLDSDDTLALTRIMDKARAQRPKWELDVERAEEATKAAKDKAQKALVSKTQAEKAKTEAEKAKNQAETDKAKALENQRLAETRADDLAIQVQRANDRLALALTGGLLPEAKTDLIRQFPVWQEGISVDTGEAYRIADILYRAKREHVTSKDNGPESAQAADFWEGGTIKPKAPAASPGFKYPKGTELEYMGARYYATVDTNDGPEAGFPTWDLLANKPKD